MKFPMVDPMVERPQLRSRFLMSFLQHFAGGGRLGEVQQSSGAGNRQSRGTSSRTRGVSLGLDHAAPRAEWAALRSVLRIGGDIGATWTTGRWPIWISVMLTGEESTASL